MKSKEEILAMTDDEKAEWWAELTVRNEAENERFVKLMDRLEIWLTTQRTVRAYIVDNDLPGNRESIVG